MAGFVRKGAAALPSYFSQSVKTDIRDLGFSGKQREHERTDALFARSVGVAEAAALENNTRNTFQYRMAPFTVYWPFCLSN